MHRFIKQIRDRNHKQVVEHLEAHGIEVIETFHPLDIVVFNPKLGAGWIEIKTTARDAGIRRNQIKFMAETRMPVFFAKTPEEALRFARTLDGLTASQKTNLAVFLRSATRDKYHPAVVERVLSWK